MFAFIYLIDDKEPFKQIVKVLCDKWSHGGGAKVSHDMFYNSFELACVFERNSFSKHLTHYVHFNQQPSLS